MVTRCPACDTLFRVTPQQLQAYRGQVRCGRCMSVFDGFKMLATLPDQGALEPGLRPAAERTPAEFAIASAAVPAQEPLPSQGAPGGQADPVAVAAERADPETSRDTPAPTELAEAYVAPSPAVAVREEARREPSSASAAYDEPAVRDTPRRRVATGWSLGSALLLLVLGAQAFYAYRVELIANYPDLKPVVARVCDLLGCSVPLPQRPKLITIEASDMQVQDPLRPGVIQLTATLRNQAGFEVGYPALDLVLTNTKEHTLARRIFMPDEYLDVSRSAGTGLPANAEITVRLAIDTGDLGAAGFRLALLPGR